MKKLCWLLLCGLWLCACAPTVENPFVGDFACTVAFTLGETEYILGYARTGEREQIEITAPETLRGLTAVRDAAGVTVSHGEMSFAAGAGDMLFDFTALLRPRPLQAAAADGGYRCTTADYTLYTDGAGMPLRIESGRYAMRFITFEREGTQ